MTRLLEARDVRHAYAGTPVLDGVGIAVDAGELVCLLGPNGAGKTTFARTLSGVLTPLAGHVQLSGADLDSLSRRDVALRVAVVPQEAVVPFPYTVHEMVAMGRAPRLGSFGRASETDERVVTRSLARLGLLDIAQRSYPTLSGGEKQRVLLARAFAQEASLLLLDEPTAHMDLGHRLFAFEEIARWIAEAPGVRAALVVSHDLTLAARFADRTCVLERGRVAADGPPAQALTRELIERVYEAEASVEEDTQGRVNIVARRSRIRYISPPDDTDPGHPRT